MAKKAAVVLIVLLLVATCAVGFTACNKDHKTTIVYLGDSIAEALIGPSPLSERDNYGYYAIVGKTNDFVYYNHSVSGHKTSGDMMSSSTNTEIGGLLGMVMRDDENAALMKSHIQQADIIHISVLGNNILQYNLGILLTEIADPDFESKFDYGEGTTLLDKLYTGSREPYMKDGKPIVDEKTGRIKYKPFKADESNTRESVETGQEISFDFPPTYQDIIDIVARLRFLNPKAEIIFQTVYNPFYEGSTHLHGPVREALANVVDRDGRFGEAGAKITTIEQLRAIADRLLEILNNTIDKYIDEYKPEHFHKLDVNKAFADVTNSDKDGDKVDLSENSLGRSLIFNDWTHPSNFGHAVIACETQKMLEDLGFANANALNNYKNIRLDQLERLFKDAKNGDASFDLEAAKASVNAATDYYGVTYAYFDAIKGYVPVNY